MMPNNMLQRSEARINYAFVPATLPVQAAITGPDKLPLSHIEPIAGGINAVLHIRWRATSPILCGNEGLSKTYRYQKYNDRKGIWEHKSASMRLTSPLKNGIYGNYILSGTSLAGMIRNVLKATTGSYYAPINQKYKGNFGNQLQRGEYPITSADINAEKNSIFDALRAISQAQNVIKNTTNQTSIQKQRAIIREKKQVVAIDRPLALNDMKDESSPWQTIAKVADRTFGTETKVLDWTNAMMGFVLGEDENGESAEEQWRPDWPEAISQAFPQGLQSRIEFGFANCRTPNPTLWPGGGNTALKINGASPKVSYHPSYLEHGDWKTPTARLAGLKVYPVFDRDPDLGNPTSDESQAIFQNVQNTNRGSTAPHPGDSDTLLQFLAASKISPLDFEGTITCTNLAPEEFGALLWALFLGEPPSGSDEVSNDKRHNTGHMKAYGMGQLAPMLLSAEIEVNPTEDVERHEFLGENALNKIACFMKEFEDSDCGRNSEPARKRLLLFKSLEYGNKMKDEKRLKSYKMPSGTDGNLFTTLKTDGFNLKSLDDELAENFENNQTS